ncbi:MAG: RNA polymerase subunit sigma-70, partial [Myxococcales bacterium]|nr:RNA polymerase subunit sigma-70 [Myxococcales bacterium]
MPKEPKEKEPKSGEVEVLDAEVVEEEEEDVESDGPSDDELSDDDVGDDDVIDVGEPVIRKKKSASAKSDSSAVARRDPLALYMKDVQRYPLLTREQEHELAVRYVEHGDLEAA